MKLTTVEARYQRVVDVTRTRTHCGCCLLKLRYLPGSSITCQVSDDKEGPGSDFQKHIVDVCFMAFHRSGNLIKQGVSGRSLDYHSIPPRLPHRRSHGEGQEPQALHHCRCWIR